MPGFHGERLSAAQPAPEEVGGEDGGDEELQCMAPPAGSRVLRAAHEEEQPGSEEGDGEEQDCLVRHGREPPGEAWRALAGHVQQFTSAFRFFRRGSAEIPSRSRGASDWYSAHCWRSLSRRAGGALTICL